MTTPLTPLEREQLRYIVERVPEWPEGHGAIWVSSVGTILAREPDAIAYENTRWDFEPWETYSPHFTRPEYEAMKAEIEAEKAESDCREVARELAEALRAVEESDELLCTPVIQQVSHALAKYNAMEEGKDGN